MRRILAVFAFIIFIMPVMVQAEEAAAPNDLEITRITPDGADVPAEKQIVITFNRPVVPIGRMERTKEEIPVTITPAIDCEWRWLNTSSLACNLSSKADLQRSTSYNIVINKGIMAEDGATIADTFSHVFTTQRPDVSYAWFRTWKSPGTPVVRLTFNQSVTKKSVETALYIKDANGNKVALGATPDPDDSDKPQYVPIPGGKGFFNFGTPDNVKSDDDKQDVGGDEARRVWIIEPVSELPLDSHASLMLEPGLITAEGTEKSVAQREVVGFDTYPEFAVLGVKCRTNDDEDIVFKPGEAEGRMCNPQGVISLSFSVPVPREQVAKNFEFTPPFGGKDANLDEIWGLSVYEADGVRLLNGAHEKGRTYDVPLPRSLKAATEYTATVKWITLGYFEKLVYWTKLLVMDMPQTGLEDAFYRKLLKPVTITFKTNHRKPNFELPYHDAVLEKGVDSDAPLYVNNLEKYKFNFNKVTAKGAGSSEKSTDVPKVQDLQFGVPFGVRELLDGKSGAVYGHMSTEPDVVKGWDGAYRLFAQVTPYQVHAKIGHFSSLVWVTDMASGAVVQDAKVTIYKDALSTLSTPKDIFDTAKTDASGIARLAGTEKIDPDLELNRSWEDSSPRIFVRVEKGSDMAVMPMSYDYVIDTWRASNEGIYAVNRKKYGHMVSWGTTAQGIYRAGDTVQYKFYVRNQDDNTLTSAPRSGYKLEIIDPMDNVVETIDDVKLNEFGAYNGEFKVTAEAPVGWYNFRLNATFASVDGGEGEDGEGSGQLTLNPMRVLVSDFTPSPFRVENSLNGDLFRAGQDVELQTGAKMHAGGPYTDASARITAIIEPRGFASKDPVAADYFFSTSDQQSSSEQVFQEIKEVDGKGELATKFAIPDINIYYGRINVESAVQDDRGKYIAALASADYVGRDRFVGMKSPQWVYEAKKPATIQYIVVDEKGAPVAGTDVNIVIEHEITNAARVKGAGNAYITNFTTEWKKEGECKGTSGDSGLDCTFTPEGSGSYRAIATIVDTKDRGHSTELGMWMTGNDYVVWNSESDVLLPIIPEKKDYHVGDKARYLVKNPYPGAEALVTIERYGVIDSFVTKLEGSTPVIEFEVKPDYMPGFYMSVLVVSPRAADKPIDENQVDLGKPTFRMGYVTVPVKDKYKEMVVTAKVEQEVYRPRDKVNVTLHAEPRMKGKDEPIELAVAVLDEAVFDLVTGGVSNFDPYTGLYNLEGLDLRNYNLLTRLIGRQKFEKKGANQGGDGGSDLNMRDLFKFVAYWNPSLKTDGKGNADVSFDVPDNLTGWRILALAATPTDRVGLGQGNFKVNRPTEVRPVMPNQVTERDSFKAGFSVMNRTDKPRKLDVVIKASGNIDVSKTPDVYKETISLEPYKRATVFMPIQTTSLPEDSNVTKGELTFEVRAKDDTDGDGMVHKMPVHKMRSLETAANYGMTTEDKVSETIAFPDNIYPDVGSVSVVLAPSVIASVEGAFRYMRDYPYLCWEQILTKGVMASHYLNLKSYMPDTFVWEGSAELPQASLDRASGFQAPNGGMTYFVAQDEYADPYLSAYTALAFNWMKKSGYKVSDVVEKKLHDYLLNFLRNNTAPTFYSEGMSSTVRAVALAALAENGKITGDDIDRFKPSVPQMSLFGKTHYQMAALKAGKPAIAEEVAKLILSHANQTGGKFIFNEELDDSYSRILSTPLRENCAILSAFTAYAATPKGEKLAGDVPFKLVRTITQTRKGRDYWENTQENMFCMNALVDYSRVNESVKPDMEIEASLDGKKFGETAFEDLRDKPVTLSRKIENGDAGRKAKLEIERDGKGRLYYAARLQYAPRINSAKPTNAGIEVTREMSVERDGKWEMLKSEGEIKRGDIVRVDLYLSLPAARNFVVVNDPVPGGLEPVNRDLATTSIVDADKGSFVAAGGSWFFKFSDWVGYSASRWSFYHQELRHDRVMFYSDYLSAGNYHLSYTAQAIANGKFTVMPTLAEEMYDPDVYGKGVGGELSVGE